MTDTSQSAHDAKSSENNLGMDYALPPRVMAVTAEEFPRLWKTSHCIAIACDALPSFRGYPAIPAAFLIFKDVIAALSLFDLMSSWAPLPFNGDGVELTLIENTKSSGFDLVLSVEPKALIERTLGREAHLDYSVLTFGMSLSKHFDSRDVFNFLSKNLSRQPLALVPATMESVFVDRALLLKKVRVVKDIDLSPKDLEYWTHARNSNAPPHEKGKMPHRAPEELQSLRLQRLKRNFLISQKRLEFNKNYKSAFKKLRHRYHEIRILQAACNLLAIERFRKGSGNPASFFAVYKLMVEGGESPFGIDATSMQFMPQQLEEQITFDTTYLLAAILESGETLTDNDLAAKGYF